MMCTGQADGRPGTQPIRKCPPIAHILQSSLWQEVSC